MPEAEPQSAGPKEASAETPELQELESLPPAEDEKKNDSLNESTAIPTVPQAEDNLLLQLPIVYKPFFGLAGEGEIETLDVLSAGNDEAQCIAPENGIIKEREGVHYINGDAMKREPDIDPALNQDFKDLVDSVIKY